MMSALQFHSNQFTSSFQANATALAGTILTSLERSQSMIWTRTNGQFEVDLDDVPKNCRATVRLHDRRHVFISELGEAGFRNRR